MPTEPTPAELERMVTEARELLAGGMPAISVIRQIRNAHGCPLATARQIHDLARQDSSRMHDPLPCGTEQLPSPPQSRGHDRPARITDRAASGRARLWFNRVAGTAILLGIGWWAYDFLSAENRVRTVCAQIEPGQTVATASRIARQHGLWGKIPDRGTGFVVETRTFGRYGCRVGTQEGVVVSSGDHFAD